MDHCCVICVHEGWELSYAGYATAHQLCCLVLPHGLNGYCCWNPDVFIVVVSVCTPNHLIATACAITASYRALGGSIGTVVFSQIFASKLRTFLPSAIARQTIEAGLPTSSVPALIEVYLRGIKPV